MSDEPQLINRFEHDYYASHRYRDNQANGIYYREFKCERCGIRYLAKIKSIRPIFTEVSKAPEDLVMKKFYCARCPNAWAIIDDTEIIDIY